MITTAICSKCGDIMKSFVNQDEKIEEQECKDHPGTALIVYRSQNETFVGEFIEAYLYGDQNG